MRYLLIYDAHCSNCRSLAETLQQMAVDQLNVLSIHGQRAKQILDKAYPNGWDYQPYLVLPNHSDYRAWAGVAMAIQLVRIVGLRNSWHIWREMRKGTIHFPISGNQSVIPIISRRRFIRVAISSGLAVAISLVGKKRVQANPCWCTPPNCTCYHVGTSYDCVCNGGCGPCTCDPTPDYRIKNTCVCDSPCTTYLCSTIYCDHAFCNTDVCA